MAAKHLRQRQSSGSQAAADTGSYLRRCLRFGNAPEPREGVFHRFFWDETEALARHPVENMLIHGISPDFVQHLLDVGCLLKWLKKRQLEHEIGQNGWLTVRSRPNVIFDLPAEERYAAAMQMLGVDFATLSEEAGHA